MVAIIGRLVPIIPKPQHFYPNIIMFGFHMDSYFEFLVLEHPGYFFQFQKCIGCTFQNLAMATELKVTLQSKQTMRSLHQVVRYVLRLFTKRLRHIKLNKK